MSAKQTSKDIFHREEIKNKLQKIMKFLFPNILIFYISILIYLPPCLNGLRNQFYLPTEINFLLGMDHSY